MAYVKADMRSPLVTQPLSEVSNMGNGWEGWDLIARATMTSAAAQISFTNIGNFDATPADNIYTHMRIMGYFKNDSTEGDITLDWTGGAGSNVNFAIDTVTHNSGTGGGYWSGNYTTSGSAQRVGHMYSSDSCLIDVIHSGQHGLTNEFYYNMFTGYASVNNDNTVYAQWYGGKLYHGATAQNMSSLLITCTGGSFAVGSTVAILGNRYGFGD